MEKKSLAEKKFGGDERFGELLADTIWGKGKRAYWEEDVKEAVKKLIKYVNLSDELKKAQGHKYTDYIHKANLRSRIKKIFGKELCE